MKSLFFNAVAVAVFLLTQPVAAAPWEFRPGLQAEERRGPPRERPREVQRERRAAPPAERSERRQQRLTEEERRELRQDIDRAEREIYRPHRQR
jgi:hypothetical protein